MKAQDLDVMADVLGQALTGHRSMLQQLLQTRTAELVTAQRAVELVREEVDSVEDRLRDFLQRQTSGAVEVMRQAASEELANLQGLLLSRIASADRVLALVQQLHKDLAAMELRDGASAYEVAQDNGYEGSQVQWLQSLQGKDATPQPGPPGPPGAGLEAPAWSPGIHREGKTVQAYMGQYFRALKDTTAEPYGSPDWERIGTSGFHLAEPWNEAREYRDGDLFVRDFGLFMWTDKGAQLLVGRGPRGEKGETGQKGKDALPAKDGRDGSTVETLQLRGGALVLQVRDHTGAIATHSVDFADAMEAMAQHIKQQLVEHFTPKE